MQTAFFSIDDTKPKERRSTFRLRDCVYVLPFLCGCIGILIGEYRMLVKAFVASVLAAACTGLSRGLYVLADERFALTDTDTYTFDALFAGMGSCITTGWLCFFTEDTSMRLVDMFRWQYAPLLTVNVVSTAVVMLHGKSIIVPIMATERRKTQLYPYEFRLWDTVTLLLLTGISGIYSAFTIRRSYTSSLQLVAFAVAVSCLGAAPFRSFLRAWKTGMLGGYHSVPSAVGLEPLDEERTRTSEGSRWSEDTEVPPYTEHPPRSPWSFRSLLITFVQVALIWMVFLIFNFQERYIPDIPKAITRLDTTYTAPTPTEIVISMYKERISDVADLIANLRGMDGLSDAQVSIYLKDADANAAHIQTLTKADKITTIPNVGREGETYLYHILNRWDKLAHQTFFLQADVHNPREFYPRIQQYYIPGRTGMLNLGWSGNICDCNHCTDQFQFFDRTNIFANTYAQINGNATVCDRVLLSYKGQFVVSAARIRGVPKSVYEELRDAFVNPDSWAHMEPFLEDRWESMSQPIFGYYLERMWNILFQCADTDVAWKCPTLLSGWRIGGSKADCQCFDE